MDKNIVVGSGASGVHFALTALKKGCPVTMLDIGREKPLPILPEADLGLLKEKLDDPVRYLLGPNYESVTLGDSQSDFYSFPPSKRYVFQQPRKMNFRNSGFEPVLSFARGGLGEAWTGGVYPFNDEEFADYPFGYKDIEPFYEEVAERIGIGGESDDLARFIPVHKHMMQPLRLDTHSRELLNAYAHHKSTLVRKYKCYLGRSRVAVLSEDRCDRSKCDYTGRCIWGCPGGAFYTPSLTLAECMKFPNFTYVPQMYVSHFKCDGSGRVKSVTAHSIDGGAPEEFQVDKLILAAGPICTAEIFLESIHRDTGEIAQLHGLMDNRQILVPFVNLKMIGKPYDPETYQFHLLAMGLEGGNPKDYVHGQITCLTTALVHPIVQKIPLDLRTAIDFFRNTRSGLGILNLNFADTRRQGNMITLEKDCNGKTSLAIEYTAQPEESREMRQAFRRAKKALLRLGGIVPPGTFRVRTKGESVHYAGTMPMSKNNGKYTTSEYCQSHYFENLYIVDGSTFPFLPAKNITFTLMANAVRVAEAAF
ncbi:MAG: GMC oxidoreductase [Planctomycetota bacterium]|jgi:choline dehydrogenase-like flavoprotein